MTNEVLEKLEDVLAEDQFELIGVEEDGTEYRLVYLMNDAVESFLVFQKAKLTGTYKKDYEGALDVVLQETDAGYALIVHQGESVCTLFFEDLVLENHFYNYGEVGHCWVKEWENIRVLEYQIAIMRDKYDYLENSCTALEKKLAMLRDFPPLNQCCYPAIPEKYLVDREEKWVLTKAAANVMYELALEAGDNVLAQKIIKYEKQQSGFLASKLWQARTKAFAKLFQKPEHNRVLKLIAQKIKEATAIYPDRMFSEEARSVHKKLNEKAQERLTALSLQGVDVCFYRQEPFYYAQDSITYQIFLIIVDKKGKVRVEVIE